MKTFHAIMVVAWATLAIAISISVALEYFDGSSDDLYQKLTPALIAVVLNNIHLYWHGKYDGGGKQDDADST